MHGGNKNCIKILLFKPQERNHTRYLHKLEMFANNKLVVINSDNLYQNFLQCLPSPGP